MDIHNPIYIAELQKQALNYYKETLKKFTECEICMPVSEQLDTSYKFYDIDVFDYQTHFSEMREVYIHELPKMIADLERPLTGDIGTDAAALTAILDFHFKPADNSYICPEEDVFYARPIEGESRFNSPRIDQLIKVVSSEEVKSGYSSKTVLLLENDEKVTIGFESLYKRRSESELINSYTNVPLELVECLLKLN